MAKGGSTNAKSGQSAKDLYDQYSASMVPLIVTDMKGNEGIGTAFHVGEGSFVTARHVVANKSECKIELDLCRHGELLRETEHLKGSALLDHVPVQPLVHPDDTKDVAVFSVPSLASLTAQPLGGHLDDWISDDQFLLNEVLVLGFPRIPLARSNVLIATRGQINAVVDLINVQNVHFIVSTMARGGFSGGAVLSEWGVTMGMVTSSLVFDGAPEELGYLTVLSVGPLLECLGRHGILPSQDAKIWAGLFDEKQS